VQFAAELHANPSPLTLWPPYVWNHSLKAASSVCIPSGAKPRFLWVAGCQHVNKYMGGSASEAQQVWKQKP
jgi:hypothetical protein